MGANLTPKKTLLLINSAICEDTLKTMNSSCVYIKYTSKSWVQTYGSFLEYNFGIPAFGPGVKSPSFLTHCKV